jgi:glycosyltransferase involved in cell wall biosynthesis
MTPPPHGNLPLVMKICMVYDCLYPHTIGGAERWYRELAVHLSRAGHDVTYVTMPQWDETEPPDLPGVQVVTVGPRSSLYANGRRRIAPPVLFGFGVLRHLATHGAEYEVVHLVSFPYFPLLAAALLRRIRRYRIAVDWFEVWTREYWDEYLGVFGCVGYWVQQLCIGVRQEAFCFSELHERRLRAAGVRGPVTVLRGLYEGEPRARESLPADQVVLFAGRHIPEKQVTAIVPAFARASEEVPELRCAIYGDGPDRDEVLRQIESYGLEDVAEAPGFVEQERVEEALGKALCVVLPSRREGYGLVLVEAMARSTPVVVVRGPDNAAVELVEEGVNGFVVASASPQDLGEAIVRVHRAGAALRHSTAAWYDRNAQMLSLEGSIAVLSRRLVEPR